MDVWESQIDTSDATFRDNQRVMSGLVTTLASKATRVRAGGEGVARQRELGKLLARERIELLLDPGTPFLSSVGSRPTGSTMIRRRALASSRGSASPASRTTCARS